MYGLLTRTSCLFHESGVKCDQAIIKNAKQQIGRAAGGLLIGGHNKLQVHWSIATLLDWLYLFCILTG